MRFKYLLYPSVIEYLKATDIEKRINLLKKKGDLPYLGGVVYADQIIAEVEYLKKKGYYESLPQAEAKAYKTTLNNFLAKPESFAWKVERHSQTLVETCELGDLRLFTGELASYVMKPEEIWDYALFGFSSLSAFVGTVSAYVYQRSTHDMPFREGYKWTTKRSDGSEIVNEVTGDMNCDLRIYQTDITPYRTLDPFGNEVEFRPELDADRGGVYAYHSTEGLMLVTVLKYIDQQKIEEKDQSQLIRTIIDEGKTLGQRGGATAEHFGGCDRDSREFFWAWDIGLPRLDEGNSCTEQSHFPLPTGNYPYVSHNGDLVVCRKNNNPLEDVAARFLRQDAFHLVKGLVYQAAHGLGRTSAKQLLDILEFRISDGFPEYLESLKR